MQTGMTNALSADTNLLKRLVIIWLPFPLDERGKRSGPSISSKEYRGFESDVIAKILKPAAGPTILTPE